MAACAFRLRMFFLFVAGLMVASLAPVMAAPPADTLLPSETKVFVSIGDFPSAYATWEKTSFGRLMNDPLMKPFSDEQDRQMSDANRAKTRLGLHLNDVKALAQGEVGWGYVHLANEKPATVLLLNIKGKADPAQAVLGAVAKSLTSAGYRPRTAAQKGVSMTVYDPPAAAAKAKAQEQRTAKVYFIHDDLLCAAESLSLATRIATALAGSPGAALNQVPSYQAIMQRCAKDAADDKPEGRWFMEPFGWMTARRVEDPSLISKKKPDPFEIYKKEGFTALQGIGGFVHLGDNGYDLTHRTMAFAPKPYERSMKMVDLPNAALGDLAPPAWVTQDAASCTISSLNLLNAFDNYASFFDAMYGDGEQGVWKETLTGWAKDPKGPKVEVRKDIVQHLKNKMVQVMAFQSPITGDSERQIAAFEADPAGAVDKPIDRMLSSDDTAKKTMIGQSPAFEIYEDDQRKPPAKSIVCVHQNTILSTSHADMLAKLLTPPADAKPLTELATFKAVAEELKKFGLSQISIHQFGQTDRQVQAYYELYRTGKLDELKGKSMAGSLLKQIAADDPKGAANARPAADASKLPEFEKVRQFFGANGTLGVSEENGWFLKGVVLAPAK
nr:hypothetical protein [uncultured bacterium]